MFRDSSRLRSHLTLALCTILHALTHAYGTLLIPLYLVMKEDLNLNGVKAASLVVTVYGLIYCLGSYPAGVLADRHNRKVILGIGLAGNALALAAMGMTRRYEVLLAMGVIGGLFGTLFHPAANALVTAHYPRSPGMAIGILGMGAGVGFFAGPQFAGWRAQTAHWQWAHVAAWQQPLIEAGFAGLAVGLVFLLIAREVDGHARSRPSRKRELSPSAKGNGQPIAERSSSRQFPSTRPCGKQLGLRVSALALVLACRDFSGIGTFSLASIFLQKAHGLNPQRTGLILGSTMLLSVIVNPLAVYLSPARRRLPVLSSIIVMSGLILATVPLWSVAMIFPVLCVFMTLQLASYAVSDAAILERIEPEVRGRAIGLVITLAGTIASSSPFAMGFWTDLLGGRASQPLAYMPIFGTLAGMMAFAAICPPLISRLGPPVGERVEPITETSPATAEPAL